MKSIKLAVVFFVIALAIFFNIERLDFGESNIIDISSFVYLLGVIAIVVTITIPALQRFSQPQLLVFWIFIYLLSKVSVFFYSGRPILGGVYTYLSITEVAFLLILIWLTHWLVAEMNLFETVIRNITFANVSKRVRQFNEAEEEIQIEMFRSRHNHHALSVVVVEPDPLSAHEALKDALKEVQHVILKSYIINRVTGVIGKYLRRTDLILANPRDGRFIILCPDTTAADAKLLIEYIHTISQELLSTEVECGTSTFPQDAVTFDQLVCKAEKSLRDTARYKKQEGEPARTKEDRVLSTKPSVRSILAGDHDQ